MTFLELVQRLASEAAVSSSGPTTVIGQTGEYGRLVKWINSAWLDIQRKHPDWLFMRSSFTVNTVASDGSYVYGDCTDTVSSSAISAFRDWHIDTFKIYLASGGVAGERELPFADYMHWYSLYNTGTQTDGQPVIFTVGYDKSFKVGPKPDAVYTISGEYQKSATELSANSDTPSLPTEFHDAIWYRALMKYARYFSAVEVYDDAKNNYNILMNAMELAQLPDACEHGALV